MTLENWSDLSGLLGSLALVVTAWRNDGLYGFIDKLRAAVKKAGDDAKAASREATEPLADPVLKSLESELTKWSWVDRWSLRAGAFLLVLSYFLRLAFQH
ncbi:MAG TPA: hypothetical protein VFF72_02625 [Caldimonas sp.]|nr:hypothetical protein [Caldimonas sp.]